MVLLAPSTTSNHPQAQPGPPPAVQLHCRPAAYFTPTTTKSDILHLLTDSILHCCANFTFYRFNSRQSLSSPRHPFHWKFLEILGLNFTFNYSHLGRRYATSQFGRVLSNSKLCAVFLVCQFLPLKNAFLYCLLMSHLLLRLPFPLQTINKRPVNDALGVLCLGIIF